MTTRRDFFKSTAALSLLGAAGLPFAAAGQSTDGPPAAAVPPPSIPWTPAQDRDYWVQVACLLGQPVMTHLARRTLRAEMPIEQHPGASPPRAQCTHLEAFGRLLCGLAPWLALPHLSGSERDIQQKFLSLTQTALDSATDPKSPDFLNFQHGTQPLVDTAFLAQAILRAPAVLWDPLPPRVQQQLLAAFKSSRQIPTPTNNNWVMFAATVEALLLHLGEPTVPERLEVCVQKMLGWYCGDGAYGDGAHFHFDYYNSFVIQPMLLDVLDVLQQHQPDYADAAKTELLRARRYAAIQERLIAPDGTFPSLGRSTTYRYGAFHLLADMVLRHELPEHVKPAQVRPALTAVVRRMTEAPGTFDANGWLQIGFCGHQPSLGEEYISTGSLYLAAFVLLPLGLPPTDDFWAAPPVPWTSQKLWTGQNLSADHAINDAHPPVLPPVPVKAP